MGVKYKNIDGSIFRGDKQLLVVVSVECRPALRNRICDILINILEEEEANGKRTGRRTRIARVSA